MTITINFDGGCQPRNPGGHMAWAVVTQYTASDGALLKFRYHGFQSAASQNTNNVAEYLAFKLALERLREIIGSIPGSLKKITIQGDSQLVIKQMSGEWNIKQGLYVNLAKICLIELESLKSEGYEISLRWIPRKDNTEADALCNAQFKSRNITINTYGKD